MHRRRHRTGAEFRLDALVIGYDIKDIMSDLKSDVKILLIYLPKHFVLFGEEALTFKDICKLI